MEKTLPLHLKEVPLVLCLQPYPQDIHYIRKKRKLCKSLEEAS